MSTRRPTWTSIKQTYLLLNTNISKTSHEFIEQYDKKVALDAAQQEMRMTEDDVKDLEELKEHGVDATVLDKVMKKQHEKKEKKKQIREMLGGEDDAAVRETLKRMLQEAY